MTAQTTLQDLQSTFLSYGPIQSVDLPTLPSKRPSTSAKPAPPRARGFAFVWYLNKKDAEKAMAAVNGKPIKRAGGSKGKKAGAEEERVVAVDWALSKDKWEKTQKGENGDEDVKMEDGVKEEVDSDNEDDDEEDGLSSHSSDAKRFGAERFGSDADSDGAKDQSDEDEEEKPVKPSLPAVDVGSTLFIRNLPFETTEEELTTL